jgi:hypothetical protein
VAKECVCGAPGHVHGDAPAEARALAVRRQIRQLFVSAEKERKEEREKQSWKTYSPRIDFFSLQPMDFRGISFLCAANPISNREETY